MKAQQHPGPSDDSPGEAQAPAPDGALGAGAVLGALRIRRVLAQHSDETIYIGFNEKLQRRFALREYFPRALCRRTDRGSVLQLRSADDAQPFARGLNAFLERARKRAELAQGTLLGIRRVWEENGTAYLCMPYPRTQNLVEMRAARGRPPDESWLRERLLEPLLGALAQLHGAGLLHGRLTPEQVLILPEARTLLLDFASAPAACWSAPASASADGDGAPPGPWDDLRALAQVVSFAMLGSATGTRGLAAALRELASRSGGVPAYSDSLMAALDAALEAGPHGAVRSVEDFREWLAGKAAWAAGAGGEAVPALQAEPEPEPEPELVVIATASAGDAVHRGAGEVAEDGVPEGDAAPMSPVSPVLPEPPVSPAMPVPPLPRMEPILADEERVADLHPALAYRPEHFPPRPRRPGRGVWLALLVVLGVAAGVGGLVWHSKQAPLLAQQHEPPAVAAASAAASTAQASAASAALSPASQPAISPAAVEGRSATVAAPDTASVAANRLPDAPPLRAPASSSAAASVGRDVPAAPLSPRAACGERTNFALYNCMQKQCKLKAFTAHEQCVLLRERDVVE